MRVLLLWSVLNAGVGVEWVECRCWLVVVSIMICSLLNESRSVTSLVNRMWSIG